MPSYWLIKSEPSTYSIDDLARDGKTAWDGVRNFQARNYLRRMLPGDQVLFYHSGTEPSVVGMAQVVSEARPDPTAWDPIGPHFDPKSSPNKPVWWLVDIAFVDKFAHPLTLTQLKADLSLEGMVVRQKGSRLSVQPVDKSHFTIVRDIGTNP
jgi:predicted RNA-binding protein with PUA-like domain